MISSLLIRLNLMNFTAIQKLLEIVAQNHCDHLLQVIKITINLENQRNYSWKSGGGTEGIIVNVPDAIQRFSGKRELSSLKEIRGIILRRRERG